MSSQDHPSITLVPLPAFKPPVHSRAWSSTPHPTLPLLATAHEKQVTVYSLSTLTKHSALTGGHTRSVRCAAWKPNLAPGKLCLVTGSFDATAGLWRWEGPSSQSQEELELDVSASQSRQKTTIRNGDDDKDNKSEKGEDDDDDDDEWEFTLVLEGHENEVKSASFSPSGQYLATSSRDKTVWIWEDVGASEAEDEWETVAVLSEHDGDVKAVAWCPDTAGRNRRARNGGADVLASASYDDTVRVWREDGDGEWVCVAVLEGHGGTVWGVQWEEGNRDGDKMPRLLSWSADGTVRVWSLVEEDEEDGKDEREGAGGVGASPWTGGGIPNTMRRGLREEWRCEAVLPKAHGRDVYSACWSGTSGRVASTGSDGIIAVYGEVDEKTSGDGDVVMATEEGKQDRKETNRWRVLGTVANAHGPYEVNHITWCKRFDAGTDRKGVEEMLVTTGDDGTVRPWQLA
jgi:WD40 repeat protein